MSRSGISRCFRSGAVLVALTTGLTAGKAANGRDLAQETQAPGVMIRSGSHPDYGRLVIDTNAKNAYQLDQNGDHVVVRFSGDVTLGSPPRLPRNVTAMTTDGPVLDLVLKHGGKIHPMRLDGRVVLDILDGPDAAAPPAPVRPAPSIPALPPHKPLGMASSPELGGRSTAGRSAAPVAPPVAPPVVLAPAMTAERVPVVTQPLQPAVATPDPGHAGPVQLLPVQSLPVQPTPTQSAPAQMRPDSTIVEAVQPTPPGRDVLPENPGPLDLLARRVKLPMEMDGAAFIVPFGGTAGAASFASGDTTYVVFDERRPVDMSMLRGDPVFGAASVKLLPGGTLFRIPLPPGRLAVLTQMPRGWRIAALKTVSKQQPIVASYADGNLNFAAEQAGTVISLADPDSGATLLVGTQRRSGQGVMSFRQSSEFILRPTIQGMVIEALSDKISLKRTPTGFILAGGPGGLLLSPPTSFTDSLMMAAVMTRRLVFSTMAPEALRRRLRQQFGEAAASPPQARGPKNRAAAETLLALGLAAEAESLLQMAAQQDPKEAASADTGALTAIAALLAGRVEEAGALADPRLDGTDEISLWRAVKQAMEDAGSPSAATVLAATAPLVFQYPAPMREHILPLIVETMIKGGEIAPAARLLTESKDDHRLDYARAMMKQAEGDTNHALDMLDHLANGRDQFDRARAAIRAVELRLATQKLDKTQAADALDKLLYAWRGDARELELRERVAELRAQTGAWRVALASLRQAETDFPEQAIPIHQRLKDLFAGMIRDPAGQQMPPLDFVATVDENADLMPGAGADPAIQQALADRLLALDLPGRAKPVLEKLMRSAKSDVAKAQFGASLATLEAHDGNDGRVRAILDASDGHDLPPELVEQRAILRAGSVAHLGDPADATALLAPLRTPRATQARAQILEEASDWAGAEQAWSDCVALTVPATGAIDDAQTRTVLRLATAAARAGDDIGLADLRAKYSKRIGASPLGDMFRLLTVEPIRTAADIKRSQQEVSLAASLPSDLKSLQARASAR